MSARRPYTARMGGIRVIEGEPDAARLRFALVASRFNAPVVERLLAGALQTLRRRGARDADLLVVRVPGAFELPLAALRVISSQRPDAVIALGAVIRGDTPHFDFIAAACAEGLSRVATDTGVPVAFGVLTTDTVAQAQARAGGRVGNRGSEAAEAAIRLATLVRGLDRRRRRTRA